MVNYKKIELWFGILVAGFIVYSAIVEHNVTPPDASLVPTEISFEIGTIFTPIDLI